MTFLNSFAIQSLIGGSNKELQWAKGLDICHMYAYTKVMTLFHTLSDMNCVLVRRLLLELGLTDQVNFRNVDISESAKKDLKLLLKGQPLRVPVLQFGEAQKVLTETAEIMSFLATLRQK